MGQSQKIAKSENPRSKNNLGDEPSFAKEMVMTIFKGRGHFMDDNH